MPSLEKVLTKSGFKALLPEIFPLSSKFKLNFFFIHESIRKFPGPESNPNTFFPLFDKKDMLDIIGLSDELEARERTCDLNVDNTTHYHIDFDLNIGLTDNQIKFLEKYVKPNEKIQTLTFQAARDCEEVEKKDNKYFPKSNLS